jgi:hypothetical protein
MIFGESDFWSVEGVELIDSFKSLNQKFTVLSEEKVKEKELEEKSSSDFLLMIP